MNKACHICEEAFRSQTPPEDEAIGKVPEGDVSNKVIYVLYCDKDERVERGKDKCRRLSKFVRLIP